MAFKRTLLLGFQEFIRAHIAIFKPPVVLKGGAPGALQGALRAIDAGPLIKTLSTNTPAHETSKKPKYNTLTPKKNATTRQSPIPLVLQPLRPTNLSITHYERRG